MYLFAYFLRLRRSDPRTERTDIQSQLSGELSFQRGMRLGHQRAAGLSRQHSIRGHIRH